MGNWTPGPWNSPDFLCSAEDADLIRKRLGREPPPARSNEGQRYVMAGVGDETKRVALVDCQTHYKRGKGYETECAEREANALLIAAAPDLVEALQDLLADVGLPHLGEHEPGSHLRARAALRKAGAP